MKHTHLIAAALAFAPLWACNPSPREASAAERPPPVLEGAWHATRVDVEYGADIGTHTVDVQPAIYIFSKSHYAFTAVNGFEARPYIGEKPTDAEHARAFAPFTASIGTYTGNDSRLTVTPEVTKDPAGMIAPAPADYELLWVDDKVWLTTTTPDDGKIRTELTRLDASVVEVSPDAAKLKGVWRRAEMIIGTGEHTGAHLNDMQPGYYVFAPPYFAGAFVSVFSPREPLGETPTEADLGKAFTQFTSFAGTYTLEDSTLVFRPLVSMNPNSMRGRPFQSIKTEWAGDDIWLIYTGTDGAQNRVRLTRVQE
ncbi:MAG: hypothetical protein Q8R82_16590 [Hyphomonadaceae bacterium]|nr:hypothetical protein [Hyphomonadaceae bacterium]